jgi:hypothetical protein
MNRSQNSDKPSPVLEEGTSGLPKRKTTAVRRKTQARDPSSDAFAYQVALYAWRDGLTANKIVRELNLPREPASYMQVKRALKRAQERFLQIHPPLDEELQGKLHERVNRGRGRAIQFYVVDDTAEGSGSVHAKAAELALRITQEAVQKQAPRTEESADGRPHCAADGKVVICNAGGRSVTEMVKALRRTPPLLDESDDTAVRLRERLLFVAGNVAYQPEMFERSANFLAVTMAQLFGAKHLALPRDLDEDFRHRHFHLVDSAALFICGAGTCEGEDLGLMSQYFRKWGWRLPPDAVGDLAFNLLNQHGDHVELPNDDSKRLMNELNPTLNLMMLTHIAANNRVLLILDADKPEQKTRIGVAVLKREYATDVVLGAKLARSILKHY